MSLQEFEDLMLRLRENSPVQPDAVVPLLKELIDEWTSDAIPAPVLRQIAQEAGLVIPPESPAVSVAAKRVGLRPFKHHVYLPKSDGKQFGFRVWLKPERAEHWLTRTRLDVVLEAHRGWVAWNEARSAKRSKAENRHTLISQGGADMGGPAQQI